MEKKTIIGLVHKGHIVLHCSGKSTNENISSITGIIEDSTIWPCTSDGKKKIVDLRIARLTDEGLCGSQDFVLRMPTEWIHTRKILLSLLSMGDSIRGSLVKISISEEAPSVSMIDDSGIEHPQPDFDDYPNVSTQNLVPKVYGNIVGPVDIDFETE